MNQQKLQDSARNAMQRSDEWDKKRMAKDEYAAKSLDRGWSRLNSFFIVFCSELADIDHDLAKQLDAFADRVMKDKNTMIEAVLDVQEQLK